VGCGGVTRALNRGWEVAEAADDGGQELQQSSSEGSRAEEEKRSNVARWNG
jgi:hypothetical protein